MISRRPALTLFGILIVTTSLFGVFAHGFLATGNLVNIVDQTSVISILAIGMTVVIVNRGIDLSVGSSLSLAGVLGVLAMNAAGGSALVGICATIGSALLVGALNGLLIAVLRVNSFMATLGTYALAGGAAISFTGGSAESVSNGALLWLGSASVFGIPVAALATATTLLLFHFVMSRTLYGRWCYAHGDHRPAAVSSGIPVRTVEFSAYVVSGLTVGVGSIVMIGNVNSAQPLAGVGLEFSAITAAIIGGTSLKGGRGSVVNTVLGSLFVGVLSSGLSFLNVDQALTYVATGALVVVAVLVSQRDVLQTVRERASALARLARSLRAQAAYRTTSATSEQVPPLEGAKNVANGEGDHRLTIDGVGKRFSGVTALKSVSFDISSGEVVALMGENGAGKSTLVKIIAGDHPPSSGRLVLDERPVEFSRPDVSQRAGIAVIHQHFTLIPDLTVAENLFLGHEPRLGRLGPVRRRLMRSQTRALLDDLGIPCHPEDVVATLSVGHRQMIEIAKAVHAKAWLVIMDEPTSALSSRERDHLYGFIERLRARRTAVLYISHKMEEVFHLASRAIVLRDGRVVGAPDLAGTAPHELVAMMVGRDIDNVFPYSAADIGEACLTVTDASDGRLLRHASLEVRAGEVVGLVGLMGAGRTELMRTVAGLSPLVSGSISVLGTSIRGQTLSDIARLGVAFVPEDRHAEGIFPELTMSDNLSLLWLREQSRAGWLPRDRERAMVSRMVKTLEVRPPDPAREIRFLSGGNQQKVVLGRWLALNPRLVLLDDPTRGVDVGAKAEIHELIATLKRQGVGVLLTSSEMPEVLGVSDRVVVMRHGETVAEHMRGVSEEEVMREAFGDATVLERRGAAGPRSAGQDTGTATRSA